MDIDELRKTYGKIRIRSGTLLVVGCCNGYYLYGMGVRNEDGKGRQEQQEMIMLQALGDGADMRLRPCKDGSYKIGNWFTSEEDAAETCGFELIPPHWIGTAGERDYLPNYITVGEAKKEVIDSLTDLHDLSNDGPTARRLRKYGFSYLHGKDGEDAGNECCEVSLCNCLFPEDHAG